MKDLTVWTEDFVKSLVEHGMILTTGCNKDGSIAVQYLLQGRSQSMVLTKVVHPGTREYDAVQSVLGPLGSGDIKVFDTVFGDSSPNYSPEEIRVAILNGHYKKAQVQANGDVKVFFYNDLDSQWDEHSYLADTVQASAILEITGPLKVGEVHEFKPSSD